MKSAFFGISPEAFDSGTTPSCAINASATIVEVHRAPVLTGLWYWVGRVDGLKTSWTGHGSINDDAGQHPAVALTASNVVVEVHDSGHGTLWFWIGQIQGTQVQWLHHGQYDDGETPGIAVNAIGTLVEVHKAFLGTGLWWRLGQVDGTNLTWTASGSINDDTGHNPCVAINRDGWVLEVHDSGHGTLWYWLGRMNGNTIEWYEHAEYESGYCPSVCLTDDNWVLEAHQLPNTLALAQKFGRINGPHLQWLDPYGEGRSYRFDDGVRPRVATNGASAIQVHQSESGPGLFANASLVYNHARWISDNLAILQNRPLSKLVLPASHDSAMYVDGVSVLAKTQDLSIYGQLRYGIRYFDIRVMVSSGSLVTYHGDDLHFPGPRSLTWCRKCGASCKKGTTSWSS